MKISKRGILGAGALLLVFTGHLVAVENLQLSVQCSNVVLSWTSSETGNQYFLVQYRPTLEPTNQWQTLAAWVPADYGTNRTHFVHSNVVQGCVYSSTAMISQDGKESRLTLPQPELGNPPSLFPLAIRAGSSAAAMPLILYPPDFDLSGFLILDPQSGEWLNGDGFTTKAFAHILGRDGPSLPGDPGDPQEGGGITDPPDTGFYRVVQHGIRLLGVTNGMTLSGVVTILAEAGNDSGILTSLSLNENGAPVSDLSISHEPFALPLSLTVDTTRMSNGVHEISAHAAWYISGADNPYFEFASEPVTISVFNEISFPKWMPMFGQEYNALYITAQSAHADAEWYVDVYGGEAGYIGTFGGHTYDGNIEIVWDLTGPPPDFLSYADEPYFDFVVETFFNDEQGRGNGSSSAAAPRTRKNWDRWSAPGDWVVANQTFWESWVGGDNLDTMTDSFVGTAETFGRTVRPPHSFGEAFRIQYANPNEGSSWQTFRQALYHPNSRNLFYSGHGGNNGIGYNAANTNVFITRAEIESVLRTVPLGQTNRHAFRFVFLDGCQTANGHLPEAFGIVREEDLSFEYYYNSGERYSAFVGWNKSPTAGYAGHLVSPDHWKFLMNFQYAWLTEGQGVREALNRAKNGPLNNNVNVNPKHLTVLGYRNLGPNQNNGN